MSNHLPLNEDLIYPCRNLSFNVYLLVKRKLSICLWVNSLWLSVAVWRHRPWSALAQVMAWCLIAPSHYLKQCWLTIATVPATRSWRIWINESHETTRNDYITPAEQSRHKTVCILMGYITWLIITLVVYTLKPDKLLPFADDIFKWRRAIL